MVEPQARNYIFLSSIGSFLLTFYCIVKERQSVAALLGDYSSDSESEGEDQKVEASLAKERQNEERNDIGKSESAEKDAPEFEDYCPFFPTSKQETNSSESIIKEKLELLNEKFRTLEGRPNANQELVAHEKVRFETRLSDWKEGGISDEFFIKKLESHERALDLRFMDKIGTENPATKRKGADDGASSPPKKKCSAVIEAKPVLYKKEETNTFDPLSFVHPDRREYVLSSTTKANESMEQRNRRSAKELLQAGTISAGYSSRTDKLIDKWTNLRKEEERMEEEKNSLEGIEKERAKEIQEWMAVQISSGASCSNPNFVPLGRRK